MGEVTLPVWLALLLLALAVWAVLDRMLVPGVRWFLRQQTARVIEELNARLPFELPPFQLTKRRVLIDRLLYDPAVQAAAADHAREHGQPRELVNRRVERYAREIVPSFNAYAYFRVGYWLARRLARTLYRVRLGYADEAGLAAIPRNAAVVFVMNHRSNMDYVLVAYLAADRTALSYAVGEWARIWPLQTLVRAMGAYFIRRNSKDALYRRVLARYVQMAAEAGVTQAIYPEGGLSRDGRLREPRFGLIDYLVRGFDPTGERDLIFVPVGLNYDRTMEDRTLLRELDPSAPPVGRWRAVATTARFVVRNLRLALRQRWYRFGYACANFGTPISMRGYLSQRGLDLRGASMEERSGHVAELGRELMRAVGDVVPVLPVSIVADVLADAYPRPLDELELKARVHERVAGLEAAGAHVYIPRSNRDYAVTAGLRMLTLRRVVVGGPAGYVAVARELPVVRYYAGSIAHFREPARAVPALAGGLPQ